MNKCIIRLLVVLFFCISGFTSHAQSSCDKLFSSGVKFQQTMTVNSQKNAISFFEKAKICYDSQAKKDLCDQQIKACRNIIAQINRNEDLKENLEQAKKTEKEETQETKNDTVQVAPQKQNVNLSIERAYVKFKGKGGEFQKVKVVCNYPDWKIAETPDWVNCSRNENNEIVIEAEKNPDKNERSGTLKIECGDKSVSLTIIQEKMKKFGVI